MKNRRTKISQPRETPKARYFREKAESEKRTKEKKEKEKIEREERIFRRRRLKAIADMLQEAERYLEIERDDLVDMRFLTKNDIKTLRWAQDVRNEDKYVNERVINFYMLMLQRRSVTRADLPNVYAVDVDFSYRIPRNMSRHNLLTIGTQYQVRDDLDLLATQILSEINNRKSEIVALNNIILVPVLNNRHWTLCIVRVTDRIINYYDSMRMTRHTREWAIGLMGQIRTNLFSNRIDAWIFEIISDGPRQTSKFDCGIFVMNTAYLICSDLGLEYSQADSTYIRKRIVWEICKNKFFGDHLEGLQPAV